MKSFLLVSWLTMAFLVGCGESTACVPGSCDDANPCTEDTCNASNGTCEFEDLSDARLCDGTNGAGVCIDGTCATQSCGDIVCDDGNPCTFDACVEGIGQCVGIVSQEMETCEVDGVFGRCRDGACDFSVAPPGFVEFELTITDRAVAAVEYNLVCPAVTLSGNLSQVDDRWNAFFDLPAGRCTLQILALDQDGEVVCDGEDEVTILPDTTTTLDAVLTCDV